MISLFEVLKNLSTQDEIILLMIRSILRIEDKIRNILSQNNIVGYNPTGDLTFAFDRAVEEMLIKSLREEGFSGMIIGEELGKQEGTVRKELIILDPIDGSANASRGFPYFFTLLAYLENNIPKRSVVWYPMLNIFYYAIKGNGAYKLTQKKEFRLKTDARHYPKMLIEVLPENPVEYILKIRSLGKFRHAGSIGLSICLIADNVLDVFIDITKKGRVLDYISSLLILEEAGGMYIMEPNTTNPYEKIKVIAARNKEIFDKFVKEFWKSQ